LQKEKFYSFSLDFNQKPKKGINLATSIASLYSNFVANQGYKGQNALVVVVSITEFSCLQVLSNDVYISVMDTSQNDVYVPEVDLSRFTNVC
jgi:hypothetical protein